MDELEYLVATNLGKLRAAHNALRWVIPDPADIVPAPELNAVADKVYNWIQDLEKETDRMLGVTGADPPRNGNGSH